MRHGAATEGLQARGIRVEAEFSIAKGDLPAQVVPLDVVASHQSFAVDPSIGVGCWKCDRIQKDAREGRDCQ
jgi:hypothetical protein